MSALVGPNGAGKTTLLRLLVGLAAPSAGDAWVLGRRPEQSKDYLASIGYLAQDVPLYRRLSADDHLRLGAHLNRDWDDAGARERLKRLGSIDRPVATLSGGQRAQVGLGLALAKQPQILFLDEPVAALDPLARLRSSLRSLRLWPTGTFPSCCPHISSMTSSGCVITSSSWLRATLRFVRRSAPS